MKKSNIILIAFAITLILLPWKNSGHPGDVHIEPESIEAVEIIEIVTDERAERIDEYFRKRGMPLAGYGKEFVAKADEYGIDWNLLAAISVIESTGGKFKCNQNPFGWGSCRQGVGHFDSISEAIDYVSWNLGGHNPRTAGAYSGGTMDDLWSYNGTVEPEYPGKVVAVMRAIEETPLSSE